VSYFANGISLDARLSEVAAADGVVGVTVGETAVTAIVVVAVAAVAVAAAGDSRRQKENLGYVAGQN